jgi:hypothetical protein
MKILLLLLSVSAFAQSFEVALSPRWFPALLPQVVQPPAVQPALNFSYGLQPLETLRTVAGRRVRGLALAEVTVCNDSAVIVRLSPIRLTQYLHSRGVEPVMASLAISTLDHASSTSPVEVAFQVAGFAGAAASILFAGGSISANAGWQVGTLLATRGAEQLGRQVNRRSADAATLAKHQIEGPDIELLPGQCVARAPLVRWPVKGRK